jgi:hypothetical protein
MRCVPAAWCVPTSVAPVQIWDDTGAGGGKPGSIWAINSMSLLAFVPGHDAPSDQFYDLSAPKFFIDGVNSPPRTEK